MVSSSQSVGSRLIALKKVWITFISARLRESIPSRLMFSSVAGSASRSGTIAAVLDFSDMDVMDEFIGQNAPCKILDDLHIFNFWKNIPCGGGGFGIPDKAQIMQAFFDGFPDRVGHARFRPHI